MPEITVQRVGRSAAWQKGQQAEQRAKRGTKNGSFEGVKSVGMGNQPADQTIDGCREARDRSVQRGQQPPQVGVRNPSRFFHGGDGFKVAGGQMDVGDANAWGCEAGCGCAGCG